MIASCGRGPLDVWPVITDMRALLAWIRTNATEDYRRNNPQGYLFARPSDGGFPRFGAIFVAALNALKMRRDLAAGRNRSLYGCRHYFATQSLQDDVPITYLAENLGNSEAMIRAHYAHVITDLRSGQLTGSRRVAEERWREHEQAALDAWDAADDVHTAPLPRRAGAT